MADVDAQHRPVARRRHLLADLLRGDRSSGSTSRCRSAATRSRFEVERVTIEPFDLRQPCATTWSSTG